MTLASRDYQDLKTIFEDFIECSAMLKESPKDQEVIRLVKEEKEELKGRLEELETYIFDSILEPELYDDNNGASLEFRPGSGGLESMLFAAEMYDTYKNYCIIRGWRVEDKQYSTDSTSGKGLKLGSFEVKGDGCYHALRAESGVHKYTTPYLLGLLECLKQKAKEDSTQV